MFHCYEIAHNFTMYECSTEYLNECKTGTIYHELNTNYKPLLDGK